MGAGRSGTTALATFLGNNSEIINLGEMHQFFEHLSEKKECSCGEKLVECNFWKNKISKELLNSSFNNRELSENFESHLSIVKHTFKLFDKKEIEKYTSVHSKILQNINLNNDKKVLLDSSKYIGRALALKNINHLDLKVIYVVRDVRGVINSFSKKVQTSKSPLSTIVYYVFINSIVEFVTLLFFRKKIIKIRYEDLIENPVHLFDKLERFLTIDLADIKEKIKKEEAFKIGHIIGGNRLKKNKKIYFRKDISWEDEFSWIKRAVFYVLSFPIMILNRYKL
tara:strand:- start:399 stop:1244 length:846 start_codon:yes stop_codon:yes gene_type:complete